MKKLSKLMLVELERKELSGRQMKNVKGGANYCLCGCCGGS
ncbi:MAG: TIGR04149 family rSAM-modified RiPP [Tannerella sp.]|jgi:natural product precursor|nr:TIGR04149 family rSAM-modified RiPP [Tannerella sp.]